MWIDYVNAHIDWRDVIRPVSDFKDNKKTDNCANKIKKRKKSGEKFAWVKKRH